MLRNRIKRILREEVLSRDVPDIPYTLNMEEVELAVKKIIHGQAVLNRDALINPESFDFYADLKELQEDSEDRLYET